MVKMKGWHVGIAAEAFAAALFARCGYDVSVQYGANQPEYDLMVSKDDKMMKVSVKGSQDGGWGLTQSYKKGVSYHEAIDKWLIKHGAKTVFCLVQFKNVEISELPRVYLASPEEIGGLLKGSANGRGETILYEHHVWSDKAAGFGSTEEIPESWKFSIDRIEELL